MVSLVPSLTEAVAVSVPGVLVGATDWCTHPAGLDVVRVGGTKNPDVARVVGLAPDLVVANAEENRAPDLEALRAGGLDVWVTDPETVPTAIAQLRELLGALGAFEVDWLDAAERAWSRPWTGGRQRAVVPIWRRPWMALGRDTFAGDLLGRLGVDNVLAGHPDRYPRVDLGDLHRTTWWCCQTSRTRSRPTTGPRRSRRRRARWCRDATSPGTALRWRRRARYWLPSSASVCATIRRVGAGRRCRLDGCRDAMGVRPTLMSRDPCRGRRTS